MGNKAYNLQKLAKAGFHVPPLIEVATTISDAQELHNLVSESFSLDTIFAVRSSANVEDGTNKSFAGYFYSELGVTFDTLFEAYQKVCSSLQGMDGKVIVQQFIPSEKSGVLFTNNGNGLMVINSNFGLCKTVVEGEHCDEWYLTNEGKLIRKVIAHDKNGLHFKDCSFFTDLKLDTPSLSLSELKMLFEEAKKVETLFDSPQDIEWCFYEQTLYILQSRPITRALPNPHFVYYDSANIAESYSGIVLPLTQSFAVRIYKTVYENLLIASGASKEKIKKYPSIFNSLVASYFGRIFYNMNSWYLMMSFLPGYKRNKENLGKMLTMNINEEIYRDINPSLSLKLLYPLIVIWKLIIFNRTIQKFEKNTRNLLRESRAMDFSNHDANQVVTCYKELEIKLLHKFHIPVENDFLLMTYLGLLRKKYSDQELQQMLAFESVSSLQVDYLTKLSHKFYALDPFVQLIENENYQEFHKLLPDYPDLYEYVNQYFTCYSGRFANELKLESDDIESDPKLFLRLLQAYRTRTTQVEVNKVPQSGFLLKRFFKYAKKREDLRLLRSNCFSLVRRVFLRLGEIYQQQGIIEQVKDIFYLTVEEVMSMNSIKTGNFKSVVEQRKEEFEKYKQVSVPSFFALVASEMPHLLEEEKGDEQELIGRPCNSGIVIGKVHVFTEFEMPNEIDFDIIVAKNTDPGWSLLIGLSKGMIIENGGILSHAAIVSRELGIPTVIGVESATQKLKTGQLVELNGTTGTIKILEI